METTELSCLLGGGGGGVHFHIASGMDVWHVRVRFLVLKSAKGVFLASKICKGCHFQAIKVSDIRKIIIFLSNNRDFTKFFQ